MSQPIRGRATILVFELTKKKLGIGRLVLASSQVLLSTFQWFQGRCQKCLSKSEARGRSWSFNWANKHRLGRGHWVVSEEELKISQPIRYLFGHLGFPFGQKTRKLGRGHWVLASCQVSSNSVQWFQRRNRKCRSQSEAEGPSCFSDQPEKHKLGRGHCVLASCQVLANPFSSYRKEVENVSVNQGSGRPYFFQSAQKVQSWVLTSCQVSLNSVQ